MVMKAKRALMNLVLEGWLSALMQSADVVEETKKTHSYLEEDCPEIMYGLHCRSNKGVKASENKVLVQSAF